jgi:hypothetical protein
MNTIKCAATFLLIASAIGCGSNAGSGGANSGSPAAAFSGRFQATWSGVLSFSSPAGEPPQNVTAGTAVITVTTEGDNDVVMAWQVTGSPPSGTITFAVSGAEATAIGSATGGSCYVGSIGDGVQATVCATTASAEIAGDALTQTQTGTFTGMNSQGVPVAGSYEGAWTGVRVN